MSGLCTHNVIVEPGGIGLDITWIMGATWNAASVVNENDGRVQPPAAARYRCATRIRHPAERRRYAIVTPGGFVSVDSCWKPIDS